MTNVLMSFRAFVTGPQWSLCALLTNLIIDIKRVLAYSLLCNYTAVLARNSAPPWEKEWDIAEALFPLCVVGDL